MSATFEEWKKVWEGATRKDWLNRLVEREEAIHEGRTEWFEDPFRDAAELYGFELIRKWELEFGLRFSALPILDLTLEADLDWLKKRPPKRYCQQSEAGKILRINSILSFVDYKVGQLNGEVVLIDPRCKPPYDRGRQTWPNDESFCGELLAKLRRVGIIPRYEQGLQSSRFGVSSLDWKYIKEDLAELLGVREIQVRLERVSEAVFIFQSYHLPRVRDGLTDTEVWYEEFLVDEEDRFSGGSSERGGLVDVHPVSSDHRCDYRSFRPLVVL